MIETTTKNEIIAAYIKELKKTPEGKKQLDESTFIQLSELKNQLIEFHLCFARLKKDERTNVDTWALLTKHFPFFNEG